MPTALPPWAPLAKPALTVAVLAVLWTWETLFPLVAGRRGRVRHAARNVAVAVLNTVVLALIFGAATVGVASWAAEARFGPLPGLAAQVEGDANPARLAAGFAGAIIYLLDPSRWTG